jgi:hypothetical protein
MLQFSQRLRHADQRHFELSPISDILNCCRSATLIGADQQYHCLQTMALLIDVVKLSIFVDRYNLLKECYNIVNDTRN